MVVFDSSVLLLALDPRAKPGVDPITGEAVEQAPARVNYLIKRLSDAKEKIVIPTPVLSEVLVHAGQATNDYLELINTQSVFRVATFDQKAAIEAARALSDAINRGGIRVDSANTVATKTKIKFDRQIVAIAKSEGAHTIYSNDEDIHKYASRESITVYRIYDLPIPPEANQQSFDFPKQT